MILPETYVSHHAPLTYRAQIENGIHLNETQLASLRLWEV